MGKDDVGGEDVRRSRGPKQRTSEDHGVGTDPSPPASGALPPLANVKTGPFEENDKWGRNDRCQSFKVPIRPGKGCNILGVGNRISTKSTRLFLDSASTFV